ncbi:MAG: hypothetical protein ACTIA5_13210, partial [Brachybacterium tyrofermentans]
APRPARAPAERLEPAPCVVERPLTDTWCRLELIVGPQADHHRLRTLAIWVAAKEAGAGPETVELEQVSARTGSIGTAPPLR